MFQNVHQDRSTVMANALSVHQVIFFFQFNSWNNLFVTDFFTFAPFFTIYICVTDFCNSCDSQDGQIYSISKFSHIFIQIYRRVSKSFRKK